MGNSKKPKVRIEDLPLFRLLKESSSSSLFEPEKRNLPVVFYLKIFHPLSATQMRFKKRLDMLDFFEKMKRDKGELEAEIMGKMHNGIVLAQESDLEEGHAFFVKFSLEIDDPISNKNEDEIVCSLSEEGWKKRKKGHLVLDDKNTVKMK